MSDRECNSSSLEDLPSSGLATRLDELMTRERHCRAEFLVHLAALDRRRGYLELGYKSLFVFCKESLRMSKGTAYRRTTAAQLISKFPVILDYLRDGRIGTTSLCDLRKLFNQDNHRELLERASRMSEEDIELLAAALDPKAEVADSIRRVPARSVPVIRITPSPLTRSGDGEGNAGVAPAPASTLLATPSAATPLDARKSEPTPPSASDVVELSGADRFEQTWVVLPPKPSELEPISADRYSVRMTVSKEFVEEFRQTRDALSHVVPGAKMEDVLRECMRIAREACARRMRGASGARATQLFRQGVHAGGAPAPTPVAASSIVEPPGLDALPTPTVPQPPAADADSASSIVEPTPESEPPALREQMVSRYIPVAVRREVCERDKGCCTFVGANGRRCRSAYQLEFHHKLPFAWGGPPTAENLTLLCARHNRHQAYEDFGTAHMDRYVRGTAGGGG